MAVKVQSANARDMILSSRVNSGHTFDFDLCGICMFVGHTFYKKSL